MDNYNKLDIYCLSGTGDLLEVIKDSDRIQIGTICGCNSTVPTHVILDKTKARKLKGFLEEFLDD